MSNNYNARMDYQRQLAQKKAKTLNILKIIGSISVLLLVVFRILTKYSDVFTILFYIELGLSILVAILGFVVQKTFSDTKLFYEFLYPEIVNAAGGEMNLPIEYQNMIKGSDFVKKVGLFTGIATYTTRYKFSFPTESNSKITIYDTNIVTRSDKSTYVHFDGSYYVYEKQIDNAFQLRSNTSPKLKGTKFEKIKNRQDIKEYIEKFSRDHIDEKYYIAFDFIKELFPKTKVYIGGNNSELHIAIWRDTKFKKLNDITDDKYQLIKQDIISRIQLAYKLDEIVSQEDTSKY